MVPKHDSSQGRHYGRESDDDDIGPAAMDDAEMDLCFEACKGAACIFFNLFALCAWHIGHAVCSTNKVAYVLFVVCSGGSGCALRSFISVLHAQHNTARV